MTETSWQAVLLDSSFLRSMVKLQLENLAGVLFAFEYASN
jgi:hypothetical protein